MTTATGTRALIDAVTAGTRTVELGQPLFTGMPCSPNHPGFRMTLIRRHGDMVRPDGGSAANEIDRDRRARRHPRRRALPRLPGRLLHGGIDAEAAQTGGRLHRARRRAHPGR